MVSLTLKLCPGCSTSSSSRHSNSQLFSGSSLREPPGDGVVDVEVVSRMFHFVLFTSAKQWAVVASELLPTAVVVVVHNVQQVQHLRDSRNIICLARLHWIGVQGSCQHLATAVQRLS